MISVLSQLCSRPSTVRPHSHLEAPGTATALLLVFTETPPSGVVGTNSNSTGEI